MKRLIAVVAAAAFISWLFAGRGELQQQFIR